MSKLTPTFYQKSGMTQKLKAYPPVHYLTAWAVHAFTASAGCIAILTLIKIYEHQYLHALWLMGLAVIIDAVDGTLARLVKVKAVLPRMDGALLDNLVDFLNYVITPCFFLYVKPGMLPPLGILIIMAIIFTSAYQFCQSDAKTPDHFFKGFPCYWNIVVFYMFLFQTSMVINAAILILFCILVFVPVKYVYPSRLDYLTNSWSLKIAMHVFSFAYGIASAMILWTWPAINKVYFTLSFGYILLYFGLSFYRSVYPLKPLTDS